MDCRVLIPPSTRIGRVRAHTVMMAGGALLVAFVYHGVNTTV
jgi:hypothetical protein